MELKSKMTYLIKYLISNVFINLLTKLLNMKIRISLVLSVFMLLVSCQKESLNDDIRLSKRYSSGRLWKEYFYDQNGLNYLIHSYGYYEGANSIMSIDEYDYDSKERPIHRTFSRLINNFSSASDNYYNEVTGLIDSVVRTDDYTEGMKRYVDRYYFFNRRVETRRFKVYEDQPSKEYDRLIYLLDKNNEITEIVWYQFDIEGNLYWSDSSHYECDNYNAPYIGNILTGAPDFIHNVLNITSYTTNYSTGKIDTFFQEHEYTYNEDLFPTKKVYLSVGSYDEYEYINLDE